MMLVHHVVTLALVLLSYQHNFVRLVRLRLRLRVS